MESLTGDSGIFGYINYLVEKDRKFILDTLLNGMSNQSNGRLKLVI
jgi:glucosamine--fructose-6-phosphate aminotransferase (isomerizing)